MLKEKEKHNYVVNRSTSVTTNRRHQKEKVSSLRYRAFRLFLFLHVQDCIKLPIDS